ncbi:7753_t:CDS:1, partial [Gigaspora margarita]
MKCGKFTYTPVLEKFEFGKFRSLGTIKHMPSNELIAKTINCCDEPNSPFTNCIQKDMKIDLHFPDHMRMKLFFKIFIDWHRYKLYECKHENITVYDKFKKIDQFVEKDLFYYVNYFLKEEMIFNTCPDCSKICVNKKK